MARRRRRARAAALGLLVLPLTGCFSSPPQIVTLDPARGSTGVPADAPVRVTFDQPMNRASVVERLGVDPPLPACDLRAAFRAGAGAPCRVVWSAGDTVMTVEHPGALFAPDTRYVFSLAPGVADTEGVVNGLDHHWDVTAAPAPLVRATTPADGAGDVPVDEPLVVGFSTSMDVANTTAAIRLDPPVVGTRVVANAHDHSRFVVLPGRLLDPHTGYRLEVAATATDEHGQPLARPLVTSFTTGVMGAGGHALVLGRRSGEPPSVAALTGLGPLEPGDAAYAARIFTSPTCGEDACGAVPRGGALTGVLGAAVAPDSGNVALVLQDPTTPSAPPRLRVQPLPGGPAVDLPGGTLPSWSPDSRWLAYSAPDGVHVRAVATARDDVLPAGDPLDAPARWSDDGSLLALPVRAPDGTPHVDLASPAVHARYPVPGLEGAASDPAVGPGGTVVAVRRDGGPDVDGTWLVPLQGGDATPRRLGTDLTPVAFTDPGTLVAAERPPDGDAALVRVSLSGDLNRIAGGPRASDLSTVVAAPSGRQIAYLLPDAGGTLQAYIENADGTNPAPLTTFGGGVEAIAVSFAS